jgi:hypothetical protein
LKEGLQTAKGVYAIFGSFIASKEIGYMKRFSNKSKVGMISNPFGHYRDYSVLTKFKALH